MYSAHDIAKYLVKKCKVLTAMKLQKLAYYSQAWSLVWEQRPLFRSRIEAWGAGPVIPVLYETHRGRFLITNWPHGDESKISEDDRETIDAVVKYYGKKTAQQLSDLTHQEAPWVNARKGLPEGARSNREITHAALEEYYSSIPRNN